MLPIIRKIDDLGRITIPKDIRNELRLYPNDLIKIEIKEEKLIISKEKPSNTYIKFIEKIVSNLYKISNSNIIITNTDEIISYKTNEKIKIEDKKLDKDIINKILKRRYIETNGTLNITKSYKINKYYILEPLISNSILIGSILYYKDTILTQTDKKLLELSKVLIENYIEE